MLRRVLKEDKLEDDEISPRYLVHPLLYKKGARPYLPRILGNVARACVFGYGAEYEVAPGWPEFKPQPDGSVGYWLHTVHRTIRKSD